MVLQESERYWQIEQDRSRILGEKPQGRYGP